MIYYIFIGLSIFGLDQYTKYLIRDNIPIPVIENIQVFDHFLQITHVENSGVAFGFHFPGIEYLSYLAFIVVSVLLYKIIQKERAEKSVRYAFVFIIVGGLGNLIDRFMNGSVTDMILLGFRDYYWPVFNLADFAISTGIVIFLYYLYLSDKNQEYVEK